MFRIGLNKDKVIISTFYLNLTILTFDEYLCIFIQRTENYYMPRKKEKKKGKRPSKLKYRLKSQILTFFKNNNDGAYNHKQISADFGIKDSNTRKLVLTTLLEMKSEGTLLEISRGKFVMDETAKASGGFQGELQLTQRGAGFILDPAGENDMYVDPKNINRAMAGDIVIGEVIKSGNRGEKLEGRIIEIVERRTTHFVGTIDIHDRFSFVIPDNHRLNVDFFVPLEKIKNAKNGDKVLVKMTSWPNSADNPYGEIAEVLGKPGSNDTEMMAILLNNNLDIKFPKEVEAQAEKVGMVLDEEEVKTRRDMRNITTLTIDPFDAKDFDDALSIQQLENGNWEIGVHIADVSHYVTPNSPMDVEALKRGNSVYLVDRVIPMLPEQLSNLACSLRPNEDKYTFSAVFEMDEKGKIYNKWFGKTAIHSNRRFTYEEAQEIIEGAEGDLKDEILLMDKIAKVMRKKRLKAGALNIESEEVRFKLDDTGKPVDVVFKTSKDANKLIEEFMLLANKKVAEYMGKDIKKEEVVPFVYRVHDTPDIEKVNTFKLFVEKFGLELNYGSVEEISGAMNKMLAELKGSSEFSLVQTMAIRTMSKAIYDTVNIGHYGLSFKHYTHFTSPIRRYADLMVHRILFEKLKNQPHQFSNKVDEICKHISKQERKAVEAERDSNKFFQVEFVKDKVGEIYTGTISGLADFGMFVRMDENYCEGMIPMQSIPGDRYSFDAERYRIVGRKTEQEYNFGDVVKVQIVQVNPRKRQIDLEIFDEEF